MKRSDISRLPQFYDRYINLVEDIPLSDALHQYGGNILDSEKLKALGDRSYGPGKWTAREILLHLTDNERIQSCRALRISRGDQTALPGYDQEQMVRNGPAGKRSVDDLLEELRMLRQCSMILFSHMDSQMLLREGLIGTTRISPLALGFVLAGHMLHHEKILRDKYYPLLGA